MGVYVEDESIRSANTNNVETENEGQFELPAGTIFASLWEPFSPLSGSTECCVRWESHWYKRTDRQMWRS